MSRRFYLAVSAAATAALIGAMTSPPAYADPNNNTVEKLTKAVTLEGCWTTSRRSRRSPTTTAATGRPGARLQGVRRLRRRATRGSRLRPEVQEFTSTTSRRTPS